MAHLCWHLCTSRNPWACYSRSRFLGSKYATSSIWLGVKPWLQPVLGNLIWQVGDGTHISLWRDKWLSKTAVDFLLLPAKITQQIASMVSDLIWHQQWRIPQWLQQKCPAICEEIKSIPLPIQSCPDQPIWMLTADGNFDVKDVSAFVNPQLESVSWTKLIWSKLVPPSNSFVLWRFIHNKLPTDDNLRKRGMMLPSTCTFCYESNEDSQHLLLDCKTAIELWIWLESIIELKLDKSSPTSLINSCLPLSPLLREVVLAGIIVVISQLWGCRNELRFCSSSILAHAMKKEILMAMHIPGSCSNSYMRPAQLEWKIMQNLNLKGRLQPWCPIPVFWHCPFPPWVEVNIDGAAWGTPGPAGCGGVFCASNTSFIGGFALPLGIQCALFAEIKACITAINIAKDKKWSHLWIEIDSTLVGSAFTNINIVPWRLRVEWRNCLHFCSAIRVYVSHTYREGNQCADKLANYAIEKDEYTWWNEAPTFIHKTLYLDRLHTPMYRFA